MITRIDPNEVLDAILVRWRLLVLGAVLGATLGLTATRLWNPAAEVTAKVMIQENTSVNPFLEDMMVDWSVKNRLPVTKHLIESRQLSIKTLRKLGEVNAETPTEILDARVQD